MSKYTTEVRFICEDYAGLDESKGANNVADIIENSRAKIFNFPFPIFDEEYRPVIETKILKHFYTREIGFETVGLWQLKLDTKLNEIMPYYNKFYESALLEFNPLYTKDLTREKNVEINTEDNLTGTQESEKEGAMNGTEQNVLDQTISRTENKDIDETGSIAETGSVNETKNGTINEDGTASSNTTNRDLFSDTPQGSLTGVENQTYLTNARKITNETSNTYGIDTTNAETIITATTNNTTKTNGITEENTNTEDNDATTTITKSNTNNETNSSTISQNKDGNSLEEYLEHVYGYESGGVSKLLKEYRETFLNIDLMVINELEELFMQLW